MLGHMTRTSDIPMVRQARLFKNGRSQAVRIPREFELPGNTVTIRREGAALILEPTAAPDLLTLLQQWQLEGGLELPLPDDAPAEPFAL